VEPPLRGRADDGAPRGPLNPFAPGGVVSVRIITGDCREVLATLPDESVHCVVTSPPYWGLRDYKVPPSVWGGDAGCEHEWGSTSLLTVGRNDTDRETPGGRGGSFRGGPRDDANSGQVCRHCNAWRGILGLEPTPELHVQHIVEIFREVRRVLRKDGTLWLNYGDCYATKPGNNDYHGTGPDTSGLTNPERQAKVRNTNTRHISIPSGLKPKDLVMMPARIALALQADGWLLRSEIVWAKKNPMPESCTDRPTSSHEKVFLFAKAKWSGPERPLTLSAQDASWLAALIDGEGTICFQERANKEKMVTNHRNSALYCEHLPAFTGKGAVDYRIWRFGDAFTSLAK